MPYFPDNDKSKMYTTSAIDRSSDLQLLGDDIKKILNPSYKGNKLSLSGSFNPNVNVSWDKGPKISPNFGGNIQGSYKLAKNVDLAGGLNFGSSVGGGPSSQPYWGGIRATFQDGGKQSDWMHPSYKKKEKPIIVPSAAEINPGGATVDVPVPSPTEGKTGTFKTDEREDVLAKVGAATTAVDLGKTVFGKGSAEGTQDVGEGALAGATKGATAGAAFGAVGAVVGGAVGAIAGGIGAKKNIKALEEQKEKESEQLLIAEGKQGATEAEEKRLLSQKYLAEKQGKYGMKTSNMYQQGGSLNNPRLLEYAPNFKFKSGGQTKGAYSHKSNPLTVIDKYGNNTGMELTGGEGVYDKIAQKSMENAIKNKNYAKAGMIVENEIQDWKRRGMYT